MDPPERIWVPNMCVSSLYFDVGGWKLDLLVRHCEALVRATARARLRFRVSSAVSRKTTQETCIHTLPEPRKPRRDFHRPATCESVIDEVRDVELQGGECCNHQVECLFNPGSSVEQPPKANRLVVVTN